MLSSWKEIAHFFGKGVRTVQRWEKTLDLPIHRPAGAPSNVVLARTSDLEEWMHRGPVARARSQEEDQGVASSTLLKNLVALEGEVFALAAVTGQSGLVDEAPESIEDRISFLSKLVSLTRHSISPDQTARAA